MIRKHDVARLRSHLGLSRGAVSLILRFLMATPQKQIPIISSRVNPALAIHAWGLRLGQHLGGL